MRTWGSERATEELARAEKNGLTLMLGIWLGHKDYFNYSDPKQVQGQYEMVSKEVTQHRNSPALLIWALGNEMEAGNDNEATWRAIEDLCKLTKKLDPFHPVTTVVAEVSAEKIQHINQWCPSLDLLGINSYGSIESVGRRLREFGWTKPYIITEFGTPGPWEVAKTDWGAPLEFNSREKAAKLASYYETAIVKEKASCLGSYAFLWGDKMEGSATWFGLFLPTGERTPSVDVLQLAWGTQPQNWAPQIVRGACDVAGKVIDPGQSYVASVVASDREGDSLTYEWRTVPEEDEKGGERDLAPILGAQNLRLFSAPKAPGRYRLYCFVRDGKGNGATINWPFRVGVRP